MRPPSAVVRLLLVLGALVALAVARPDLLTGAARSPVAWLVAAAVVALATVSRLLVARRLHRPGLAPWVGTAVVLACLALLVGPSLHETTLVEDFPALAVPEAAVAPDPAVVVATPTPTVPASAAAAPRPPGRTTGRVAAATPPSRRTATGTPTATVLTTARPATRTPTASPLTTARPATPPTPPPPTSSGSVATRLASGRLQGIGHSAAGGVALYRVGGASVLRFEDVDIQGTPGPSVYLVAPGKRTPAGGLRLGRLKAEKGSFSYPLPAGFDPTRGWSVLVWCDPYDTPIAAADLR